MEIRIRDDHIEIEGYVNAIERNSKPLMSRIGRFIERICKGAFSKALKRNDDVHILLNHDWGRDLGSTKEGNLELYEDNIGLRARATIRDAEVIKKARAGELVGWSFGFNDRENGVINLVENGMPTRAVTDLDLYEVSILDKSHEPAYDGTLISARDTESGQEIRFYGENFIDDGISTREEEKPLEREETQPKQHENVEKDIDYTSYEKMIEDMKGA